MAPRLLVPLAPPLPLARLRAGWACRPAPVLRRVHRAIGPGTRGALGLRPGSGELPGAGGRGLATTAALPLALRPSGPFLGRGPFLGSGPSLRGRCRRRARARHGTAPAGTWPGRAVTRTGCGIGAAIAHGRRGGARTDGSRRGGSRQGGDREGGGMGRSGAGAFSTPALGFSGARQTLPLAPALGRHPGNRRLIAVIGVFHCIYHGAAQARRPLKTLSL